MRVLYACYGKAGLDCLYQLLNVGHEPSDILAVTYPDSDQANRELLTHLRALRVSTVEGSLKLTENSERVREFSADFLFSVYYRDIIGPAILDSVKVASINMHPSLLPKYRGCFSIPWSIINAEKQTGMTFHYMDVGIDTGNIVLQVPLEIHPSDTAFSLYHRVVGLGAANFARMHELVVDQRVPGFAQPKEGNVYPRAVPHSGRIDLAWGKRRIYDFIRAMYFPPHRGAELAHNGRIVEFTNSDEFDAFCHANSLDINPQETS